MKKITNSVALRTAIAAAVCISFIIYTPLLLSSSAAAARTGIDLKTESQYRSEAGRYDSAISAISGIATMKLETPDDLKKALDILDRERPNLKLHRSRLIVMAVSDVTFAGAVKRKMADKQAAEALLKELNTNPKAVLKLGGAETLKTRMQSRLTADAAILGRAAERLKVAAERIIRASQGSTLPGLGTTTEFKLVRASFSTGNQPITTPNYPGSLTQVEIAILTIYGALVAATVIIGFTVLTAEVIKRLVTVEDEAALAQCQSEADDRYSACVARADRDHPFPFNIAYRAICGVTWLSTHKDCLLEF